MTSQAESSVPFNLEQYLSKLTLQPLILGPLAPTMPHPAQRSTLTPISLVPGGYRRLREMYNMDLKSRVVPYFQEVSSEHASDGNVFRDLEPTLEGDTTEFGDGAFSPYLVNNAVNVLSVLNRLLVGRVQPLLEIFDHGMREWSFQPISRPRANPGENQPLDPILFCRPGSSTGPKAVKLVVVPLGPWEFAPRDFQDFASLRRFDDTPVDPESEWGSRDWINADRMWAYLYDLCLDCDCTYFAVTSHQQWCFGVFSPFYTSAWCTQPLSFDNQPVSIVEILTYWILSSFEKRYTLVMPEVIQERSFRTADLRKEQEIHAKRFLDDGISESGPEFATDDLPPTKRQRRDPVEDEGHPSHDSGTSEVEVVQEQMHTIERFNKPRRLGRFRRQRAAEKRKYKARRARWETHATESVISVSPSVAPSSAEALPQKLVPKGKAAAIQRWRDMVGTDHDDAESSSAAAEEGQWVDMLVCNTTTGSETGDHERKPDHTCSSCAPSSPTVTACSLSEEELARWNPKQPEDFTRFVIHQWF